MPRTYVLLIGILLVVIVVFWIGVSLYTAQFNIEINPNAEQHTTQIRDSFDQEVIDNLNERLKVLKVSPTVFHELEYQGDAGRDEETRDNNQNNQNEDEDE